MLRQVFPENFAPNSKTDKIYEVYIPTYEEEPFILPSYDGTLFKTRHYFNVHMVLDLTPDERMDIPITLLDPLLKIRTSGEPITTETDKNKDTIIETKNESEIIEPKEKEIIETKSETI